MNTARFVQCVALLASLLFAVAASSAPAGRVQLASGEVQIVAPDGKSRPAARGDVVDEGDTVVTGATGALHLRMLDDGIIAVRANTRMRINQFRWSGKEDGSERSLLDLVKGGFRTITGVIGRRNKDTYTINTPIATIGIRGTDHEVYHLDAGDASAADAKAGSYSKVNVGETFLRTAAGTLELGPNQVGFAPLTPGAAPLRLERVPQFMRGVPAIVGRGDQQRLRQSIPMDRRHEAAEELAGDWSILRHRRRVARLLDSPLIGQFESREGAFNFLLSLAGLSPAPAGIAFAGSLLANVNGSPFLASGSMVTDGTTANALFVNDQGIPGLVANNPFYYTRDGSALLSSGRAVVDGELVGWGVYAGGTAFNTSFGAAPVLAFPFVIAAATPVATLQLPGTLTYSTSVGSTTPVTEARQAGGTAALTATVQFGAIPLLTGYTLTVTDAALRNWMGNLPTVRTLNAFANGGVGLNVTCSGGCPGAASGSANGYVIGHNRGGLISSYDLHAGPAAVIGSIVVKP